MIAAQTALVGKQLDSAIIDAGNDHALA